MLLSIVNSLRLSVLAVFALKFFNEVALLVIYYALVFNSLTVVFFFPRNY